MTLSHLIQLKPRLLFCKIRFSQPTKWGSSSTSMSSEKKSTALRKRKASSVGSFVHKYVETHQGIFGKLILGQNELGRSFHSLKDIMLNLKEKIAGKSAAAFQNNDPNKCEVGASESNVMNTLSDGSNFSSSTAEKSKELLTVGTEDMVGTTKYVKVCSKINEKAQEDNIIDSSRSLKIIGALNEPLQLEESSIISKLKSDPSDPNGHVKKILQGISTEKLGSTESERQSGMIVVNSESNLGSESEIGERTGSSSNNAEKDMGSPELLVKSLNPNSKSTQSQTIKVLQQFGEEMTSSTVCKSRTIKVLPNNVPEVGALSSVSTESAKKAISLEELFRKRTYCPETGEMKSEMKSEILTRNIFKDTSTDAQEKVAKDSNISSLLNCLKKFTPPEQLSDNKGKQTLLNEHIMIEKKEKEHGVDIAVPANNIKSTLSTKISLSMNMKAESSVKPVLDENKAILKFLPMTMKEYEIAIAFKNRDDIVKIECSSMKGSKFKTAQVCFKTTDGLKKALETPYLIINNSTVTIEAASSLDSLSTKICIPNLIGDHDAPAILIKNPSKTVMIKGLTDDISSHHIQEALLPFSKSEISSFFFGSSSFVAYVEFSTEEGKERALAEQSLLVEGKSLSIFRVDSPRTTVIRITLVNRINGKVLNEIVKLCKSYGQVKNAVPRNVNTVDVHFYINEWPNMLKIIDRLNGHIVDGHRLKAKTAEVFPPEVIHALWGQAEERRRLKGLMRDLFKKVEEEYVVKADIFDLAARYYSDDKARG